VTNLREFRFNGLERRRVGGTRDQMELSVPVPQSPSGKVYRYSPNPDVAPRLFLLGDAPKDRTFSETKRARIANEPGSPRTVCPYSGFIAEDEEFFHLFIAAVKRIGNRPYATRDQSRGADLDEMRWRCIA
jgi:hypothetical protein